MEVVRIMLLFFKSSVIMTHFGKNPVSGGRPPRDRSAIDSSNSIMGILFHVSDVRLIDVRENSVSIIKIERVNKT